jgi:hypothetical protein
MVDNLCRRENGPEQAVGQNILFVAEVCFSGQWLPDRSGSCGHCCMIALWLKFGAGRFFHIEQVLSTIE